MSKSTFRILFYIRKNYTNRDGKVTIMARVTINGKMIQFSSKLSIETELWNIPLGRVNGKDKKAREMNEALDNLTMTIKRHYNEIERRDGLVDVIKLRDYMLGEGESNKTILEVYDKMIEDYKKLAGVTRSTATLQKHKVTRRHIAEFIDKQLSKKDMPLKQINHMFVSDFFNYLMIDCKCSHNTANKFLQFFKRAILIAKNNDWIRVDPFANFKIRIKTVDRGYLNEDDLKAIMSKEFSTKRLTQIRDIFVFSCFTGLAYIDVKGLTNKNIVKSFDGNLWIVKKRQKTDVESKVLLLDISKAILEKYQTNDPEAPLLPVPSNQKMNAYLKEIGELCGVEKPLTFHLARHTFATTVTLSKGVPIETVSKMLGHTNIKTTQIYARITDQKISHDMLALSSKLGDLQGALA